MAKEYVGFVESGEKIHRFTRAVAKLEDGQLDVEAGGVKWHLRLYGIRFRGVGDAAELSGKQFGPTSDVGGDPFAEGGIETPTDWYAWKSLEVRCGRFDPETKLMTVSFDAEVRGTEFGRERHVTGSVRCRVVSPEEFYEMASGM